MKFVVCIGIILIGSFGFNITIDFPSYLLGIIVVMGMEIVDLIYEDE